MNPAAKKSQPIGFRGCRDARRIPKPVAAMLTALLSTFAKFQELATATSVVGSSVPRSMYISASAPIISAIDTIPIAHASLEAVLDVILEAILSPCGQERKRGNARKIGMGRLPARVVLAPGPEDSTGDCLSNRLTSLGIHAR